MACNLYLTPPPSSEVLKTYRQFVKKHCRGWEIYPENYFENNIQKNLSRGRWVNWSQTCTLCLCLKTLQLLEPIIISIDISINNGNVNGVIIYSRIMILTIGLLLTKSCYLFWNKFKCSLEDQLIIIFTKWLSWWCDWASCGSSPCLGCSHYGNSAPHWSPRPKCIITIDCWGTPGYLIRFSNKMCPRDATLVAGCRRWAYPVRITENRDWSWWQLCRH